MKRNSKQTQTQTNSSEASKYSRREVIDLDPVFSISLCLCSTCAVFRFNCCRASISAGARKRKKLESLCLCLCQERFHGEIRITTFELASLLKTRLNRELRTCPCIRTDHSSDKFLITCEIYPQSFNRDLRPLFDVVFMSLHYIDVQLWGFSCVSSDEFLRDAKAICLLL